MLKFDANRFANITSETSRLATVLDNLKEEKDKWRSDEQKNHDSKIIRGYASFLNDAGMVISLAQVNRICAECDDEERPLSKDRFSALLRDLLARMADESELLTFLSITPKEAAYFEPKQPLLGKDFVDRFPTEGAFELDEAGKCLALGRSTAATFHLMRLLEVGIRALARCLGITDPIKPSQRNWAVILQSIKDGIGAKWPSSQAKQLDGADIFDELYASLDAVKNPWRNATMHVDNKYTNEEAEHIFIAVKGFMKKLASRMDEQGEPKA